MANGILLRHRSAQLGKINADLRAENNSAEPRGLLHFENRKEFVEPLLIKALRRHPHLRFGMPAVEVGGLFFQESHQMGRLRMARIATRNEYCIDARKLLENVAPFL